MACKFLQGCSCLPVVEDNAQYLTLLQGKDVITKGHGVMGGAEAELGGHRGLGLLRFAALLVLDHGRKGVVAGIQPHLFLLLPIKLARQHLAIITHAMPSALLKECILARYQQNSMP